MYSPHSPKEKKKSVAIIFASWACHCNRTDWSFWQPVLWPPGLLGLLLPIKVYICFRWNYMTLESLIWFDEDLGGWFRNFLHSILTFNHSILKFHGPYLKDACLVQFFISLLLINYSKKWVRVMKIENNF